MSFHDRTQSYLNRLDEIEDLAQKIRAIDEDFVLPAPPDDARPKLLSDMAYARRMQLRALMLGVPVGSNDRPLSIEIKIIDALPGILEAKGMVVGAVVLKNYNDAPDTPHRITETLSIEEPEYVQLRLVDESQPAYTYGAVNLALYATLHQETPQ